MGPKWVTSKRCSTAIKKLEAIREVVALKQCVYVLTTGGTMEKVYSERNGAVENLDNKIDRYLRLLRLPETEVNIVPLMNKDSLEMTEQDRILILGMVRAIFEEEAPILITHGTDTMVETGLYLQRALPDLKTPIVLTGAMTPLGFEGTDGLQNLTESLLAVQLLPPGIYIVMHGSVYPADRVRKDHALSRFVWSDTRAQ
jgi:L-asparaginase